MKSISSIFLSGVFLFIVIQGNAQEFGGNPPSLQWKQIKTDSVRVLFPDGLQQVALKIAAITSQMGSSQFSIGNRFRKINIVLQNQTTISNAYVGLGPRRSEFYMTPQQNSFELGSLPWYQQLAQHEWRHVQQFNNFNKGIARLFYILAGEYGLSLANNTAIPNWFWEGDAVYSESHLSTQGRGRLPYFFNGYRSLWAASKKYSWLKLRNGSLRDFVPDHYQLGYLLTAYGREKYGDTLWAKVTDDAARFKGVFYPFQRAVKRYTGASYAEFRKAAFDYFSGKVKENTAGSHKWAKSQKHFQSDEEFPQWTDASHLIFVKSSYNQIPRFIKRNISTGEEEKIGIKDISLDKYFSYKNGRIVYAAIGFDMRWGWRDYSDIRLLDIETGKQQKLTRHKKYFAPDISADGRSVVAVNVAPDGSCALHILDTDTGGIKKIIPNKEGLYYTYPKFYGQSKIVSAVRNTKGEMALGIFSIPDGKAEWLLPFNKNVIGFINVSGDTISVTASSGETDKTFVLINNNVYGMAPLSKGSSTGAYQLAVANGQMAWADFTAAGFHVVHQPLSGKLLQENRVDSLQSSMPTFGIHSLNNDPVLALAGTPGSYTEKKYHKGSHLINFHSWLPSISTQEYSISFFTENVLNTLQGEAYFTYNTIDDTKKLGFIATYGAWFPWVRLGGAFSTGRTGTFNGETVYFDESEARTGFLIPFNFSGGKTFTSLRVGTDYVYSKPFIKGPYKDILDDKAYGYTNSKLIFNNQVQKARQQIYPRWAQTLKTEFNYGVTHIEGRQFLVDGMWYLPGLSNNHSLVLNTAWHSRDTVRNLLFANSFPFSRGYRVRNFFNMGKLGANYHLPLFYPDWGFASIIYFQRVRANLFFDYTQIADFDQNRNKVTRNYRSYGTEIFFDTKWWNQQPISFGIRYSRLIDAAVQGISPNQWEFVLPVTLITR